MVTQTPFSRVKPPGPPAEQPDLSGVEQEREPLERDPLYASGGRSVVFGAHPDRLRRPQREKLLVRGPLRSGPVGADSTRRRNPLAGRPAASLRGGSPQPNESNTA
ncbi:hypothetical protein GCM10010446_03850 [Streptomyces enissocaesilis]|uniref:Uncharacterized protein n=1 Tax=Streptomyces enissocaesilis TaxID=332589 RepID=A0ABN3WRA7_9ACTN